MRLGSNGVKAAFLGLMLSANPGWSNDYLYQDDDLLCGPGFSLETYHQRIQQHVSAQRALAAEYERTMIRQAAAEQIAREKVKGARRARFEKEARRREEVIARRKAESGAGPTATKPKP